MWYKLAQNFESEIFNIDKSQDPKNLEGALRGFIFDIKKRTDDKEKISNAFRSYKNQLINEGKFEASEIESLYSKILKEENLESSFVAENLSFIKPVRGQMTSDFGPRKAPMPGASTNHQGIDFDGETGDPVMASESGNVSHAGERGSFGNLVIIDHGNGYETYYAHLNSIDVSPGENVQKGQIVGALGSTGRSTGSHLHFEVRLNGKPIKPEFS